MKVAILGAGLAGLSCAATLERHGVRPVILEKRNTVGDRFVNAETIFSILNRPYADALRLLARDYHLYLTPVSEIRRLVIHSASRVGRIDGRIGWSNIRGHHPDAFESQLARQVGSRIETGSALEYAQAAREFDRVVLATGDGEYAFRLGNYRCDLTCTLRGATVRGRFRADTPHVWFRCDLLPKGLAWLIPYSQREANLSLALPDYLEDAALDPDAVWERFLAQVRRDVGQELPASEPFQVRKYWMGRCRRPKIGGTYFVGNCLGAPSPGLGFGQFVSMLSGVYAAYDICGLGSYEEWTRPLLENYEHSLRLRRYLEELDDPAFDRIAGGLGTRPLAGLAGFLARTGGRLDLLKWLSPLLRS